MRNAGIIALVAVLMLGSLAGYAINQHAYDRGVSDGGIKGKDLAYDKMYDDAIKLSDWCIKDKVGAMYASHTYCDHSKHCVELYINCYGGFMP